jgi:hypothetical protein
MSINEDHHNCKDLTPNIKLKNKLPDLYPNSDDNKDNKDVLSTYFIKNIVCTQNVVHNKIVYYMMINDWKYIDDLSSLDIVKECLNAIVLFY